MIARTTERITLFLGPQRLRLLVIWIAATGLASLILNTIVNEFAWVAPVQTVLAFAAIIGAVVIVGGRMDQRERVRWAMILAPAFGAVLLGMTVLQPVALLMFGAAAGWILVGMLLFRTPTPTGYRKAIKALRRSDLPGAISIMDEVIKDEPNDPNHYRFRAELLRLNGKIDRARRDYAKMIELDGNSAVGYNGLAEVELQAGNYERARDAAQNAVRLAPEDWVALYNMGMIEDRLQLSDAVIEHLNAAAAKKVPDARHRLLIHFYLLRAFARLERTDEMNAELNQVRRNRSGLEEWQKILASDQAEVLRQVLGDDVKLAGEVVAGSVYPSSVV